MKSNYKFHNFFLITMTIGWISCLSEPNYQQENLNELNIETIEQINDPELNLNLPYDDFCVDSTNNICVVRNPLEDVCSCEWTSWHERGLVCFGVNCSDSCEQEIIDCHERGPICIIPN